MQAFAQTSIADVLIRDQRAMALYERLGFKHEGRRGRAYMVDGKPVDDCVMAYLFAKETK